MEQATTVDSDGNGPPRAAVLASSPRASSVVTVDGQSDVPDGQEPDLDADSTYRGQTTNLLTKREQVYERVRRAKNQVRLNTFKTGSEDTHAVRGRVGGARRRASSHVPCRAGVYEYAEPLNDIHYDAGFNCVVPIYIGGQIMRMCVDTGGGKSMVRKSLVPKLQKRESTRDHIIARDRIIEDVTCAGICNGMSSNKVEVPTKINLTFRGVDPEGGRMPPTVDYVI